MCSFYKGFPFKLFFTWKSFVNFFRIFKLGIGFFSDFAKKPQIFQNCAHLFILNYNWANFQRKKKNKPFWIIHSFITRTGEVGLGRFRMCTAGEAQQVKNSFFPIFFFLYIFSFFFSFLLFLLGLNTARARLGGFLKIRLKF